MSVKSSALNEFLNALAPHVSSELRKGIESIEEIFGFFPGQTAGEIHTTIKKMLASSASSVSGMIDRAKNLVLPAMPENAPLDAPEAFLKDAGRLSPDDLKALMAGISLPAPKTKKAMLGELKQWIESKGTYAPKSDEEKKRERAQMLAGDLPQKMGQMTGALADEIIRRAEAASKDKELGADGFAIFASLLLGTPMKGSKSKLLKEIKAFVDRLAVSAAQTGGF